MLADNDMVGLATASVDNISCSSEEVPEDEKGGKVILSRLTLTPMLPPKSAMDKTTTVNAKEGGTGGKLNSIEGQIITGNTNPADDAGKVSTIPSNADQGGSNSGASNIYNEQQKIITNIAKKSRYANFMANTAPEALIRSVSMEEVVKQLTDGNTLWKIRGASKWYHRHYKVDMDNMTLVAQSKKWWTSGGSSGNDGPENAVPLLEITEVRAGWKTDMFNKISDQTEKNKEKGGDKEDEPLLVENRCFSVIHGVGGRDVLDIVASSEEMRDNWVAGLGHLVQSVQALHKDRKYDLFLRTKFEEADKDTNGALSFDEVCKLLKKLNISMDNKNARKLFDAANTDKKTKDLKQVLNEDEFIAFYHALLKHPEIEKLYKTYASEKSELLSTEQLLDFLKKDQGMTELSLDDSSKLIQDFELSTLKEQGYMTKDGFYHMLLSPQFNIYNHKHQETVHMDMNQPLAHYYISSSHNTYLIGNQLAGESSVEGYISAIKSGCKVVELDVWDGDEGNPIIYHGHTLTSKITLEDVLKDAIKPYAFHTSPYPLILSIENHLSLDQQRIMVKLFLDILGDMLATEPVPKDISVLPSPTDLMNKVIIKAKKPAGEEVECDNEEDEECDAIDYIDSDAGDGQVNTKKKSHKPLAPELRQIVNVCTGKKFSSFESSFEEDECVHFPSLRENKAKDLTTNEPEDFIKFTERQIAKIYPLGTRTDSSNLKPYPFWAVGAQVVTLNMQTDDKPNFYNRALYASNGNCGYVLKPDILLRKEPYCPTELSDKYTKILRVTVVSGQHIPNSAKKGDIVDPYVQVKVRGHDLDKQKQRTATVKNNGFNPVWDETLELQVKVPDLSLVYFTVRDESSYAADPVLALCCIPFNSLMQGYRHVHLASRNGESVGPCALFVKISIHEK
ncbi:unnamed protein product [Meganyctiphanes norvegica]|uniref:Phosphoinositide phospholipase C n=1 Tax=Meganyctiphanes norvegica TaxID=48144 RepID=A0AAV2PLQ8_MEGNR